MKKSFLLSKLFCIAFLFSGTAWGYEFVPKEAEFWSWPTYCKVVYTRTDISRSTKWSEAQFTQNQISEAHAMLGSHTFGTGGVHHHCAGTIWLTRARFEADPQKRKFYLNNAQSETAFTMQRIEPRDPIYAISHIQMSLVLYEQNKVNEALTVLSNLIKSVPTPLAYTAKAHMYHGLGDIKQAHQALVEGNEFANGESPEIHYNLGLILLKMNRPQLALKHAKKAYQGGYPLPGLKKKLKAKGIWDQ